MVARQFVPAIPHLLASNATRDLWLGLELGRGSEVPLFRERGQRICPFFLLAAKHLREHIISESNWRIERAHSLFLGRSRAEGVARSWPMMAVPHLSVERPVKTEEPCELFVCEVISKSKAYDKAGDEDVQNDEKG